jgi:integrase
MTRRRLFTLGARGTRVIGFDTGKLVRVEWREQGRRLTRSWASSAETRKIARAFALGAQDRLERGGIPGAPPAVPTLDGLFSAYLLAVREGLRPRTIELYRQRWAKFVAFAKPERRADTVTPELLDAYRAALAPHHVPNQVKELVRVVRIVFNWGLQRGAVPPSRVQGYRVTLGKDAKRAKMGEYSAAEAKAILGYFDPRSALRWRPYVLTTLLAFCGPRQRAARMLTWEDVDLAGARIHWRGANDKVGTDRFQPMPRPVLEAFFVALGWRQADGYAGAFVFYPVQARGVEKAQPWSYQGYVKFLRDAERAAGIKHVAYRGAHGFRRGVVGNVIEATSGNLKLAASWIGDSSVRVIEQSYALEREGQMRDVAAMLTEETATERQPGGKGGA